MKLIMFLAVFVSVSAYSEDYLRVKCELSEVRTENSFLLSATLVYENGVWTSLDEVAVYTRRRGRDSNIIKSDQILAGKYKIIPAGELALDEVISFSHIDKEGEILRARLNVGHPTPFSSSMTDVDGYTYKSKCRIE